MVLDAIIGAGAVLLSLAACLSLLRLQKDRPADSRGMVGLAATAAHLMLSLAIPAVVWVARKPVAPMAYVLSVLVFYWLSLIIMVVIIIRWIRGGQGSLEAPEVNSRQKKI